MGRIPTIATGFITAPGHFVPGANAVLTFPLNTTTAGVPVTVILEGRESDGLPTMCPAFTGPPGLTSPTRKISMAAPTLPASARDLQTSLRATRIGFPNQINLQINHLTILTPANTGIGAINFETGRNSPWGMMSIASISHRPRALSRLAQSLPRESFFRSITTGCKTLSGRQHRRLLGPGCRFQRGKTWPVDGFLQRRRGTLERLALNSGQPHLPNLPDPNNDDDHQAPLPTLLPN